MKTYKTRKKGAVTHMTDDDILEAARRAYDSGVVPVTGQFVVEGVSRFEEPAGACILGAACWSRFGTIEDNAEDIAEAIGRTASWVDGCTEAFDGHVCFPIFEDDQEEAEYAMGRAFGSEARKAFIE